MVESYYYLIQAPMEGQPEGYYTIARATTPEGAADVVRVLLANMEKSANVLRVKRCYEAKFT